MLISPTLNQRRGLADRAAHDRAQPRQQLLHPERFWQIVVGAGVDAVDPLGPAAARGEDQHRDAAIIGAPALQHRQPVHAGQAEIENDRGVVLGVAAKPRLLAVADDLDDVAGGFQPAGQIRGDPPIVFDHQHPHHFSLVRLISPLWAST